jgi:hypothetical protein
VPYILDFIAWRGGTFIKLAAEWMNLSDFEGKLIKNRQYCGNSIKNKDHPCEKSIFSCYSFAFFLHFLGK